MMVDPVQALANIPTALKHTATSTMAIPTYVPSVSSVPSPFPDVPYRTEYQVAGDAGKRTLWVVFVIMTVATVGFSAMSWSIPISKRLYHVITTLIVMTAALSYFAMATGDGISFHKTIVEEHHSHVPNTFVHVNRQVFWARYVDWTITTPLLLLDLALIAGLSGGIILLTIVADVVMVVTGLFAAFGNEDTPQKWGWYAIACIAYLFVVWFLAVHGRAGAQAKGGKVGGFFASIAGFTLILWTAYPIVWGIADGSRKVNVDGEIIAYAVLDVLAKPVFGLWLLLTHINLPETNVDLGGFWAHGFNHEGAIRVGDDEEGA